MEILKSGGKCSLKFILMSVVAGLLCTGAASAQTLTTLTSFNASDSSNGQGAFPNAGLIADANGNLFGTTVAGGFEGAGTVFEIVNNSGVYAGTPTTLVSFIADEAGNPYAGLLADAHGNLFGATVYGGDYGAGMVFEVANNSGVYANTPTPLATFNGADGYGPYASLIADANGNLFGTASFTAFEVVNNSGVYASTPTALASFSNLIFGGLVADANGNLFGTTADGGPDGFGTVFEIVNNSGVYDSTPITLATFNSSTGQYPFAGLIIDAHGNLFGTTFQGGANHYGTVFEIVNNSGVYAGTPITLASFGISNAGPYGSLIADANGNLFGTTSGGGVNQNGTVFEIVNNSGVYDSTPITLASFNGSNGGSPVSNLIADAHGNLFGTTVQGGVYGYGTVFELTGSGFVPPKKFDGTPGSANCAGQSVSAMAKTYGGTAHAAAALGYASVKDLQSAVAAYCGN